MDQTTIVLLLVLTIIVLALMARVLKIELDWTEGKQLPRLKIHFFRDTQSFNSIEKPQPKSEKNSQYCFQSMLGTAVIKYGEDEYSTMKKAITLKSMTNGLNQFHYFNADSGAQIKLHSGFSKNTTEYKRLREFPSWDGTAGSGISNVLHRVSFPIPELKKNQTHEIELHALLQGHYQETFPDADVLYHEFYFRIDAPTDRADFVFEIEKGTKSNISKILLLSEYAEKELLHHEILLPKTQFELPKPFGHGWIKTTDENTQIFWHVPTHLKQDQVCRLQWYTAKNKNVD